MANAEHVGRLRQRIDDWNTWRENHPDITPDLTDANLARAILSGANLSGANLDRTNLSGADLCGANFCEARFGFSETAISFAIFANQEQTLRVHINGVFPFSAQGMNEAYRQSEVDPKRGKLVIQKKGE